MTGQVKPLIGVTGSKKRGRIMTLLNRFALWRGGARSVALKPGDRIDLEQFDGFVIGGGDDIDPTLYHGEVTLDVRIDHERDALEMDVLRYANENQLPVLGICRGSQMMNVFFGGSLHHDIYETGLGAPKIRTVLARKKISAKSGTKLNQILECDVCHVNSLHHQSVDRTGDGFIVAAKDEHDIIQAIERETQLFMIGVQWHPEMLVFDRGQVGLFRALADAALGKAPQQTFETKSSHQDLEETAS